MRSASSAPVAVIGGANVDICGQSHAPLTAGDSNPGTVRVSMGGVGRNIAHNLRLMGVNVLLFTALGRDDFARRIRASCESLGIDITHAAQAACATSTYLYIADERGEMRMAVNDMAACAALDEAYLARQMPLINSCAAVVAEANLPEKSLTYLAEHCEKPLFVDPVSAAKAVRLLPILRRIHTLKPNRLEAQRLTGIDIADNASAMKAADALIGLGVRRAFITLGSAGALAAEGEMRIFLPPCPVKPVSATGAGDAYMAALALAHLQGMSLRQSAALGAAAASIAMESADTINDRMSPDAITSALELYG